MSQRSTKLTSIIQKCLTILVLVCLVAASAHAQRARLKTAKRLLEKGDYQGAIELYLQVLDKNDDSEAKINIAEAYTKLKNQHEMEYWWGQVVLLPNMPEDAELHYAQALQMNEKYEESKKQYRNYLDKYPNSVQALNGLKACEESVVQNLKASGVLYHVEARKELNSNVDDFGPSYYREGLVFCSSRDRGVSSEIIDAKTGDPFTELFYSGATLIDAEKFEHQYTTPKKFDKKLSSKYHDGPASFSKDGLQCYFTRNNTDGKAEDGIIRLKIYKAEAQGGSWGKPKSLPFNSEEYTVAHPSLSVDELMLFFASDMPGGFGGMDLYVSYLENGRWSPPVNLGPTVNTEGNEIFPFHHDDGTLYFSSDGHVGVGGVDIYYTKEEFGMWMEPTNLGSPVNSGADDFSLIMNEKKTHGYFASNRDEGTGGDDLYSFTKLSVTVEVLVFNENDNLPIEGAEVFTPCSPVESFTTNADGKVFMELPLDKACDFAAEKPTFKPNSVRGTTEGKEAGDPLFIQIPLGIERIYDLSGTVIDGFSKKPVEGAKITLVTTCDGEEDKQETETSAEGVYEFSEIRENCDCRVSVFKEGYTEAGTTFSTGEIKEATITRDLAINCKGGPECEGQLSPCDTMKLCTGCECSEDENGDIIIIGPNGDTLTGLPDNEKRLVHIYYDFDDARIRDDAIAGLDDLVGFLNSYANTEILITSHTDARGNKGYNKRLSKRRAESVVRYLLKAGINKRRLKAKGMGEEVMVNGCYDGEECDETQHQENRRTEFQVVGFSKEIKSNKPEVIKVNPCRDCDGAPEIEGAPDELSSGDPGTNEDPGFIEFIEKKDDDTNEK